MSHVIVSSMAVEVECTQIRTFIGTCIHIILTGVASTDL